MKRKMLLWILCIALVFLSACSNHGFDEEWVIGKTSAEIEERYGDFDRRGMDYEKDGLLRSSRAGYVIKPSRVSWLGTTTEELFVVYLDQEGIAYACGVEPGNWGG